MQLKGDATMRVIRLALIAAVVPTMCSYTAAQTHKAPFTLTISTDTPTVKSGSAVSINIAMMNTSNHDVSCSKVYMDSGVDMSYHYDVMGPLGERISKGIRKHPELEAGSIFPCTLEPGKSSIVPSTSRISALFDMSKPGMYAVQVWRKVKGFPPCTLQ